MQMTNGLAWRERPGTGPVLVCLHGIGSGPHGFDALAAHLPDDIRMIAWSAPGYGDSQPLARDWPVARDYAEALAALVAALGLGRFHLLGHSLGTLIAADYAAHHPQQVAGLILVSCAQGMGVPPGADLPAKAAARLSDLEQMGPLAFARARAPRLVHEPAAHPDLVAAIADTMAKIRLPGYAQAVRMLSSGDLAGAVRSLRAPTTIVVGAQDIVTPPAQSRGAWDALPPAARRHFALLPETGHAAPQQAPAALARIITKAIRQQQGEEQ
ncbi:MAG: alpha/beta hydrolase [Rhodobacteraceae bacterium]|nr:alpha/beta hydrolase [Paracoccaceae bacterium]